MHSTPTFETEVFRIISNVQLVKGLLLRNEQQIQHYLASSSTIIHTLTTPFVTKATPNSKYHISKVKSSRTYLIGYSGFISHE